jgi:50S ribosomal protein L16 3-hydroxylase
MKQNPPPLGGLSARQFLREYWQKKPLLVRNAFPEFNGLLTPECMAGLACEEDTQSRLVQERGGRWELRHGPFDEQDFTSLPKTKWTLLVQGLNHYLPEGERLLQQFSFIPHARLDDLMVSYAPKGGSVGPHFDSYDVFLLQGMGHRRWQISAQQDMTLVPGAPLKILQNFQPEQEWVLGPGDMLYLPPRYAHHGVAQDDCMTYSVGFRAPSAQELVTQFLVYLQDQAQAEGMYEDPDLTLQRHPSLISSAMLRKVSKMLTQIRWDQNDISHFLGQYLSEPKPHIVFERPARPLSLKTFAARAEQHGLHLALTSQMLCHDHTFFINGETYAANNLAYPFLLRLADARLLAANSHIPMDTLEQLHQWYLNGYLAPAQAKR